MVAAKIPWLRTYVSKAHILKEKDAFNKSIFFDFAEHPVFRLAASESDIINNVFGVGKATAKAIDDERDIRKFTSLDDACDRWRLQNCRADRLRVLLKRFAFE